MCPAVEQLATLQKEIVLSASEDTLLNVSACKWDDPEFLSNPFQNIHLQPSSVSNAFVTTVKTLPCYTSSLKQNHVSTDKITNPLQGFTLNPSFRHISMNMSENPNKIVFTASEIVKQEVHLEMKDGPTQKSTTRLSSPLVLPAEAFNLSDPLCKVSPQTIQPSFECKDEHGRCVKPLTNDACPATSTPSLDARFNEISLQQALHETSNLDKRFSSESCITFPTPPSCPSCKLKNQCQCPSTIHPLPKHCELESVSVKTSDFLIKNSKGYDLRLCKYFIEGKCTKEGKCPNLHLDPSSLKAFNPKTLKTWFNKKFSTSSETTPLHFSFEPKSENTSVQPNLYFTPVYSNLRLIDDPIPKLTTLTSQNSTKVSFINSDRCLTRNAAWVISEKSNKRTSSPNCPKSLFEHSKNIPFPFPPSLSTHLSQSPPQPSTGKNAICSHTHGLALPPPACHFPYMDSETHFSCSNTSLPSRSCHQENCSTPRANLTSASLFESSLYHRPALLNSPTSTPSHHHPNLAFASSNSVKGCIKDTFISNSSSVHYPLSAASTSVTSDKKLNFPCEQSSGWSIPRAFPDTIKLALNKAPTAFSLHGYSHFSTEKSYLDLNQKNEAYLPPSYPCCSCLEMDHPSYPAQLKEMVGRIASFAKDQQGCRYLQKVLENNDSSECELILKELLPHLQEYMVNPFGNYLCQKLLDYATNNQKTMILKRVVNHLVVISLNPHGTRAAQKLVEHCTLPEHIELLRCALASSTVTLVKDLNGNHVIQKCLIRFRSEEVQFVFDAMIQHCVDVATHRNGCCVLQRCLDYANFQQKHALATEITQHCFALIKDPFGNYVVQYVLEMGELTYIDAIATQLIGQVPFLSTQKFSSNVVEKCIRVASSPVKKRLIMELYVKELLQYLLRDAYANYVIQTSIDHADASQRELLLQCLTPLIPLIHNTPYGRRIMTKLNIHF